MKPPLYQKPIEFRKARYRRQAQRQTHTGFLPTEHWEQVALFQHFDREIRTGRNLWLAAAFAVPNGARTSWGTAVKLKMEGLKSGVHDVFIPVPRRGYVGLTLEMKRKKGGEVSNAQKWWATVLATQGWLTFAPAGWEIARDVVDWYFGLAAWPYHGSVDLALPQEPRALPCNTLAHFAKRKGPPGWPEVPS